MIDTLTPPEISVLHETGNESSTLLKPADGRRGKPTPPATEAVTPGWGVWADSTLLLVADVVSMLAVSVITWTSAAYVGLLLIDFLPGVWHVAYMTAVATAFVVPTFAWQGLYPGAGLRPAAEFRKVFSASCSAILLWTVVMAVTDRLTIFDAGGMLLIWAVASVVIPSARLLTRSFASRYAGWGQRAIVFGDGGPEGREIYESIKYSPQRGLRAAGYIDIAGLVGGRWRETVGRTDATWAVIAVGEDVKGAAVSAVSRCRALRNVVVVPRQPELPTLWVETCECGGMAGLKMRDDVLSPVPRAVKRTVDVLVAGSALLAFSPLFAVVAAVTKWKSPGPIFYGHTRIGRNGRKFKAWKFRSMVPDADAALTAHLEASPEARAEWERDQKLKHDPRVIPGVGKFLRETSLDELPQLWNVLVGDMSLVGPRPIVDDEVARYEDRFEHYLRVRPGVSGLWQVSGRNLTTYDERVRLDTYYVRNWSPWLDTYILMRTVKTVLRREGAY